MARWTPEKGGQGQGRKARPDDWAYDLSMT